MAPLIALAVVAIFWVAAWYVARRAKHSAGSATDPQRHPRPPTHARSGEGAPRPTAGTQSRPDPFVYRPSQWSSRQKPKIVFSEAPPERKRFRPSGSSAGDLSGLCDAYTGAQLDPSRGIVRCSKCQVCYHLDSFQLLREQNNGQCASCGSTEIHPIARDSAQSPQSRRDFQPDIVTLRDYRSHVGRVITFEGHVLDIKVSKSGNGFAAMFEPGSWTEGLKLIFPNRYVERVGGPNFIFGMLNRTVRVRGLLVKHTIFGHQIIVSERSMIISIT